MTTYQTDDFVYEPIGDKPAAEALQYGCAILEKAGLDYWLSCGTILGLYRDGALIKTDTDIDIGMMKKDVPAVIEAFKEHDPVLVTVSGNVYEQICYMFDGVLFDIAFYQKSKGRLINYGAIGYVEKPVELIDKREAIEFGGYSYPCPQMPEYLAHLYGDWRTPSDTKRRLV